MIVANSHAGIEEIKEFTKKPKLNAIENICEFKNIKIKKDKNFDKLFINNKKTIIAVNRLNKVKRVDILINSLSGIIGQLTKNVVLIEISNYWFLLLAVLVGGQLGNFLNLKILPTRILALVTAALVLFVAVRMGIKLFT